MKERISILMVLSAHFSALPFTMLFRFCRNSEFLMLIGFLCVLNLKFVFALWRQFGEDGILFSMLWDDHNQNKIIPKKFTRKWKDINQFLEISHQMKMKNLVCNLILASNFPFIHSFTTKALKTTDFLMLFFFLKRSKMRNWKCAEQEKLQKKEKRKFMHKKRIF